jgi:hypothetical protein
VIRAIVIPALESSTPLPSGCKSSARRIPLGLIRGSNQAACAPLTEVERSGMILVGPNIALLWRISSILQAGDNKARVCTKKRAAQLSPTL